LERAAASMAKILVLHGPNLNMLGQREPQHYGSAGLDAIDARLAELAAAQGHGLETFQSNAEHLLVERVQAACGDSVDFIIINPAAFTHTSIALRDAFLASGIPFIEIHLSNIHRREVFRHHSYFSDIAVGVIAGLGPQGYELAFHAAVEQLGNENE
jgi:3-dehydroquinate dehydratase-2